MPCSVQVLIDRLAEQPEELAAFEAMMADPAWSAAAIRKAVAAEGYEVGQQTVGRHRTGSCKCFRDAL